MALRIVEEKSKSQAELYREDLYNGVKGREPKKLDPMRNIQGQERIKRSRELLRQNVKLSQSDIIDVGCGTGLLANEMVNEGAKVIAVDLDKQFLGDSTLVSYYQACLPELPFGDASFDGVIFTDVIAEVEPHLYRLTFSEISRLLKKGGWILCSTPLDLHSYDAEERFIDLVSTEFEIFARRRSYHKLSLLITNFLKAPLRFKRGGKEKGYRLRLLSQRSSLLRVWFYLNTISVISFFWYPFAPASAFCLKLVQKNRPFFLLCERISEIIWGSSGQSHIIVLAKKNKI